MRNKLSLLIICITLLGCVHKVSIPKENKELIALQKQCDDSTQLYDSLIKGLEDELSAKNERLAKFNQIDKTGKLKNNTWKGDTTKPVTGKEKWMK